MPSELDICVVISNLNGARFLPKLFESLGRQSLPAAEIIVVDRESTDDSADFLKRNNIRVVSEAASSGLAAGYAAGAAATSSSLLFFANEDIWLHEHCLETLARATVSQERVGAADPWQWTYDGTQLIHAGVRFKRTAWSLNSPYPLRRIEFLEQLPAGAKIPFPCAGAFLIRRQAYEEAGGWDESFFLDHEDLDLAIRLWAAGWSVVTCPEARVFHAVGASSAPAESRKIVPNRRYRASYVNSAMIGVKYFSAGGLVLTLANWAVRCANNVLKLRWRCVVADVRVLAEVLGAFLPARKQYRSRFSPLGGESYFNESRFNADTR